MTWAERWEWIKGHRNPERWCRIFMGWALKVGGRAAFDRNYEYFRNIPFSSYESEKTLQRIVAKHLDKWHEAARRNKW